MRSKMFPEFAQKVTNVEGKWSNPLYSFIRRMEEFYPDDKYKVKKAEKVLDDYFKELKTLTDKIEKELEEILNPDSVESEQQQVQSSDQQTEQQRQFQTILDQLKNLIDSNNNNMIICIEQLQDIITGQAIAVNNLSDMLADLTNRVNLIAAGYTASLAKYIPDKTSQD